MKTCTKCGVTKPLFEFYDNKAAKSGKFSACRKCCKIYRILNKARKIEYDQKRYAENADQLKTYQKQYKAENPDKIKQNRNKYHLKKRYGLSPQEKQSMLDDQNNCCAICKIEFDDAKATHVDHNHDTNELRGILCRNCNLGLGHFKDSKNLILDAVKYLTRYERS